LFTSAFRIADEANLDIDQRAAFFTIAKQVLLRTLYRLKITIDMPKQMIMFLGGEGGTGKSKVLKALTQFMTTLKSRHRIRLGAQTGVAAGNINGSTLHSLLDLDIKKKKKDAKPKEISDKVCSEFSEVEMFFIDEVSMTGCATVQEISVKLADAKSTKLPFGGVDVIFAGDFYQLPPNTNDPLYKAPSIAQNINLTKAGAGFLKFQDLTHVIILRQQHRMHDKAYRDMVQRFRSGNATAEDSRYCTKRRLTKNNTLSSGHLSKLPAEPIIIVKNNEPRFHINMIKAKQHALASGQKLLFNVARDTSKIPVSNPIRKEILMLHESGDTSYASGVLPLFIGMPVMIKKNLGTELGISNGSTGKVHDIVLDPRENIDYSNNTPHYMRYHAEAVYVELDTPIGKNGKPETKFQLTGLPPNVFVLSTKRASKNFPNIVTYTPRGSPITYNMTRVQFCILPAYAITVNSSQGRTLQSAIINLEGKFTNNVKAYVMLSRLTNGSNFGILGD
jgi:energy-coupling factor transporter ATP-binding protein EcfA2